MKLVLLILWHLFVKLTDTALIPTLRVKIRVNESELSVFEHRQSGQYSNLLLRQSWLYATGSNFVFKLNASNISDKRADGYIERSFFPTIKLANGEHNKNSIKLMVLREQARDLIICGTNLGRPHVYDIRDTDLSNSVELNGIYMCPGVETKKNVGLISYDSTSIKLQAKGLMYSAVWLTEKSWSDATSEYARYGIYRKEIETKESFIRTLPLINWLWEPEFISIVEEKEFVYFFFTENSIEDYQESNKTIKRVSRVARVCKNDQGVRSEKQASLNDAWTTFRKVRIECECQSMGDELYGSEIFKHLKLVNKIASTNKYMAVFVRKLETDSDHVWSVVCEFDLNQLQRTLTEKKFLFDRRRVKSEYLDYMDNDFGCNDAPSHNESPEELDNFYSFLSENTILGSRLVGECKIVLPYEIESTTISKSIGSESVYFGTSSGHLVMINRQEGIYSNLTVLELNESQRINQILIDNETDQLYFTSDTSIRQLSIRSIVDKICIKCEIDLTCHLFNLAAYFDPKIPIMNCTGLKASCCEQEKIVRVEKHTLVLNCGLSTDLKVWPTDWTKDGHKIKQRHLMGKNGELILPDLEIEHAGIYECKLENKEEKSKNTRRLVVNLRIIATTPSSSSNPTSELVQSILGECTSRLDSLNNKLAQIDNECF